MTDNRVKFNLKAVFTAVVGLLVIIHLFSSRVYTGETAQPGKLLFPRAIGFPVGQVGWMEGSSLGDEGKSWRAGIRRMFDVRDYKPFVEIGEEVGVRFMSLFILGELDRLNAPSRYPTSTPYGHLFDNSKYVGPGQLEIMDFVKSNAAHIEFGITGVMHEYWDDGIRTRAEWYDAENQKPREEHIIRGNIELIKEIMAQYNITPENGHSFPESFISYGFYWNPDGPYSLGKVLSDNGVKYASTHFSIIDHLDIPPRRSGGFDHGVLLLDRVNHGNSWYEYASLPNADPDELQTIVVETHWANWLAPDDFLQPALNKKWVQYMKSIQAHPETYLAKNTEQLYSQWLYKENVVVSEESNGSVLIDASQMPEEFYQYSFGGNMVLAVKLGAGEHIARAVLDGNPIAAYYEDEGYGYLYLPPLERKQYRFEYEIGTKPLNRIVYNSGTYNVYGVNDNGSSLEIDLKMYGTQNVEVRSPRPHSVRSMNNNLVIKSHSYDVGKGMVVIEMNGRDMQGERGIIVLDF
jgi:hypothetical protein